MVLHFGLRGCDLQAPRTVRSLQTGSAAFFFFHSGFRINRLLNEVSGPAAALYMSAGAEQRVLVRALLNETDSEIAADLGVSLDAIKKCWARIYERTGRVAPYALGPEAAPSRGRRSLEKRRHLLEHLRTHPEELRPHRLPRT